MLRHMQQTIVILANSRMPGGRCVAGKDLVHAGDLRLKVALEGARFGNPKKGVRGCFTHAGRQYRLKVTDPEIKKAFLAELDGAYNLGGRYITVSLGREFKGDREFKSACYKLIAAVIGGQSTA